MNSSTSFPSFSSSLLVLGSCVALLALPGCSSPTDSTSSSAADLSADAIGSRAGAVYTMSNAADANQLLVYRRAADGHLTLAATYATGGQGTGVALGSQSAIFLTADDDWLFAVNAGSNELSAFSVEGETLRLVDCIPSGGTGPLSVTERGGIVYVLNGGSGNISGFARGLDDHLHAIEHSSQPLGSSASGPAQIAFSRGGSRLFVTEKATSTLDTFDVGLFGEAYPAVTTASNGATPFGFAVTASDDLIVSEAFGAAAGASALSSYRQAFSPRAPITSISASVADTQTAACWVNLTHDDRVAFTSNTGSGTISSYSVGTSGTLSLSAAEAAATGDGTKPEDMALSRDEAFLYVVLGGSGSLAVFSVDAQAALTPGPVLGGLPASVSGLAAR